MVEKYLSSESLFKRWLQNHLRSKKVEDEEVSLMELMERAVKEVHTE